MEVKRLLALLAAEALAVAVLAVAAAPADDAGRRAAALRTHRRLVAGLALTDLALWSDASYLRHRSLGDRFTPFADHPAAMEHFPGGSLVAPPRPSETP